MHLGNLQLLLKLRHFLGKLFELGVWRGLTGDPHNDVGAVVRKLKAAVGAAEDRKVDAFRLCERDVTQQIVFGCIERGTELLV